jgi:serine/threonine protein kinase/Tfp pilus assembly protein PilF
MAMKCPKCQFENPADTFYCGKCGTQLGGHEPNSPEFGIVSPNSKTETLQTPIKELTTGSTFAGRYQIIEELGKGGMGKVYKVFDKEIQAKMALKLIKPEVSADKNTIERFRNELKIARDISHKNICRMYDLGKEAGNYFITMEYVSGEDLKSFIRRSRQLVIGTAIFIAKQVCEGLAEAHRLGVVHRDLKPGNIMIDREGNAKIMDFGIARSISVKGITGAGVMIGTPEYMSPEQVEGKEVDRRSDIYSLGIIIYEMVTGRVPFEGDTPFTIGVKHKSEIPKDPRELNAQIPQDLSRLIFKCLEKDKEKRYKCADELRADLEKIEKGIPTAERPVPKRTTATAKPITLTISRKKLFVPLSIIVAIAIICIGLWRFLPKHHVAPPPPSGKPSLAILYFENISGDKSLDPWETALTELLITKLAQSRYINVLSSDRIFSLLKRLNLQEARKYSTEDLVKVANEGGAIYTLSGSLMKAGKNIIMTLTLQKPRTGEVISPLNIECNGEEEIFPKVDELARTIKSDMNLSPDQIASDIDKEVGKITTPSPEAYKFYSEGRKYHNDGEYRKSIQLVEKAIAIDPRFAMAFRSLAVSYGNLGYYSESKKNLRNAFELSDRVSDRERYIIQSDFYSDSEKTYDKAIETYNKLLELYPNDYLGNCNSALLYASLEEWDKAIERNEAGIKYKDDSIQIYILVANDYMAKGLYEKAKEAPEFYIKTYGDNTSIRWELGQINLCQGKYAPALLEVEKALTLSPNNNDALWLRGFIYLCKGDSSEAEKHFEKLLASEEKTSHLGGRSGLASLCVLRGKFEEAKNHCEQGVDEAKKLSAWDSEAYFHLFLAYINLRSRNYERALKECDKAWAIASENELLGYQRISLFWKASIFLEMNQTDKAQQAAAELKSMIEKQLNKKLIRLYDILAGMIEFKRNNFNKAIDYFNEAVSLVPYQYSINSEHAGFVDCLAQAYYKSGDMDKARQEYEKIISLTTGRIAYGDIYAKSFYMLGKIAEHQGDKGRAIGNYRKFLDLWKDADPGLPEVADAKKHLAGLQTY